MTDHQCCEDEILRLGEAVQSLTRSGCDNALRYAADLAAEKRAGAARVERIRAAILDGASDASEVFAVGAAMCVVDGECLQPELVPVVCAALLALIDSRREARAELARLRDVAPGVGMGPSL